MTDFKLPSIAEAMTQSPTEKLGEYLKAIKDKDWYFSGFWQKFIISLCFFWSIGSLLYGIWILIQGGFA